jgi:hypothetical protein
VRVGAQSTTRVRYGKRRYPRDKPTNVFLGWTHPAIDKKTGQVGVQEVWLNATLPPEERRRLRNIPRWTPAFWRQALGDEGGGLRVHTDTSSACPQEDEIPPAEVVENCLFPVGPEWTNDGAPPITEPDFPLDDRGIPIREIDPEDLQ